jgi:hypothetical protein
VQAVGVGRGGDTAGWQHANMLLHSTRGVLPDSKGPKDRLPFQHKQQRPSAGQLPKPATLMHGMLHFVCNLGTGHFMPCGMLVHQPTTMWTV